MKHKLAFALTVIVIGRGWGMDCCADIVYPKPPEGGREIAQKSFAPVFLPGVPLKDVTFAEPFRSYGGVGGKDLVAGRLLSVATSGSWRYLVMRGSNVEGAMQWFNDPKDGNALKFSGFYYTDFSSEMLEAMRRARKLPQVKKQDFEPRRLCIPGILFDALWLHGKSDDIIMPFSYGFKRNLKAYHPYSEKEIIEVLKPEAKKLMKQPDLIR